MGYLLLAVMFYTVVRFGTQIWTNFRYEKSEAAKIFGLKHKVEEGKKRIELLEKRVLTLETEFI